MHWIRLKQSHPLREMIRLYFPLFLACSLDVFLGECLCIAQTGVTASPTELSKNFQAIPKDVIQPKT